MASPQRRAAQPVSQPLRGLADPSLGNLLHQAGAQLGAGLRGAADTASMGLYDPAAAALQAAFGHGHGGWAGRFRNNLSAAEAQDRADARDYRAARMIGQGAGIAASVFTPGGAAARAVAPALKIGLGRGAKEVLVKNLGHVFRTGAGSGAVSGLGGEVVTGLFSQRGPSLQDAAGAAVGGAIGGLASPLLGSAGGGAVTGAATSATKSLLNGKAPQWDDVLESAGQGAALGRLAGAHAVKKINNLSSSQKGQVGESLSRMDAFFARNRVLGTQERIPLSDYNGRSGYMRADLMTARGPVEAKFGQAAELTKRQMQAINEGHNLAIQRWNGRDVGNIAAGGALGATEPVRARLRTR